jgi:ferredoxin-NADP reductase
LRWFTFLPVLSDDPLRGGTQTTAVEAARRFEPWHDYEVYVCGSAEMVQGTVQTITEAGVPAERIHVEEFQSNQYPPAMIGATNVREPA